MAGGGGGGGVREERANVLFARSPEETALRGLYPEHIQNRTDPGVRGPGTSSTSRSLASSSIPSIPSRCSLCKHWILTHRNTLGTYL